MIVHEALDAADRGRFGPALAALSEARGAAALALRATLAGAPGVEPVDAAALEADGDPALRLRAVESALRLAVARFDADARSRLAALAERLAESLGPDAALRARRCALWDRVARGEDVRARAANTRKDAAARGLAAIVIEAEVLGVWSALNANDRDDALRLARTASRMASAERLLVPEILAHLALAHVRRGLGKPHLAARILAGLGRTAPQPWRAWIAWERGLAGADHPAFGAVLDAARAGDRDRLDAAGAALLAEAEGFAPAAAEARGLLEALDATRAPTVAGPFVRGEARQAGFLWADGGDEHGTLAWVWARPDGARRMMAAGRFLHPELPRVDASAAQSRRALALLCELALRGARPLPQVFEDVYGFAYVPSRHAGAFRVMLHRARALTEGMITVHRDDDELSLQIEAECLLPDPRARVELDERVLSVLGRREATASEVAEELGVTARAVQKVLRRLLDDGVCEGQAKGRARRYRVLDTTFTEPSYVLEVGATANGS